MMMAVREVDDATLIENNRAKEQTTDASQGSTERAVLVFLPD